MESEAMAASTGVEHDIDLDLVDNKVDSKGDEA
jgi:hypothetical protein